MTEYAPTTALLYLRQAVDKTKDEMAVNRQRDDCEKVAQLRGWRLGQEYMDNDTSGAGKVNRPGFEALLDAIHQGEAKVIIAWNLDRLTRNRRDTVRLIELCQEQHVTIALARGSDLDMATPFGRMMADQLAGWARYEIDQKGDRQKASNAQRAALGHPYGSVRVYGYERGVKAINEPEAAALREMARRIIAGHSFTEVTYWLNQSGIPTTNGKLWYGAGVRRVLTRKSSVGIREYKGAEYAGTWEPIFDPETWETLQLTIKLRREKNIDCIPKARRYLLTGLCYCGVCGAVMSGTSRMDKKSLGGAKRRAYNCRKKGYAFPRGGCGHIRRGADPLDHLVKEAVLYRLDTPELGKLLTSDSADDGQLRELLQDRQAQQLRIDSLVDNYGSGLLTRPQLARAKGTAQAELQRLEADIDAQSRSRRVMNIPVGVRLREPGTTPRATSGDDS